MSHEEHCESDSITLTKKQLSIFGKNLKSAEKNLFTGF